MEKKGRGEKRAQAGEDLGSDGIEGNDKTGPGTRRWPLKQESGIVAVAERASAEWRLAHLSGTWLSPTSRQGRRRPL